MGDADIRETIDELILLLQRIKEADRPEQIIKNIYQDEVVDELDSRPLISGQERLEELIEDLKWEVRHGVQT